MAYNKKMWPTIIKEIQQFGNLSEKQIAEKSGTTQPTINRLKNGKLKSTSFEIGNRLMELHRSIKEAA